MRPRPPGRRQQHLQGLPLDDDSVPRAVESGVDVSVLRVGGGAERFGLRQAAQDRMGPLCGNARRLFVVAHERGHLVSGPDEDVEHSAADVTGGAGQEYTHEGCSEYVNDQM